MSLWLKGIHVEGTCEVRYTQMSITLYDKLKYTTFECSVQPENKKTDTI
jgi:hypothetical protein